MRVKIVRAATKVKIKYMICKLVKKTKVRQNSIHLTEGKNEKEKEHIKKQIIS